MIKEILLRTYTPYYRDHLLDPLESIIKNNTKYKVSVVDHTEISLDDFNFTKKKDEYLVSLDRYIANKFDIPYMRVSRIFNNAGDIIGRLHITDGIQLDASRVRLLDTDTVTHSTFSYASKLFSKSTSVYCSSLIHLDEDQDLIDIEDLVNNISLCNINGIMFNVTYMMNEKFFTKRTSLNPEIIKLFKSEFDKFTDFL